jgi:hypothetical protein
LTSNSSTAALIVIVGREMDAQLAAVAAPGGQPSVSQFAEFPI